MQCITVYAKSIVEVPTWKFATRARQYLLILEVGVQGVVGVNCYEERFCLKVSVDLRCGYYSYRILPPPPFPCGLRHQLSYTRNLKIVNGNDVSCRQMDVWLDECMSNWMDGWLVGWLVGNDEHFIEYLYVCNSSFMVFLFMFFLLPFQSTSLMA